MTDHDDSPLEGRVYPAGAPVRSGPVMLPAHAPRPGEVPPWRTAPPPPRPAPEPDPPDGPQTDAWPVEHCGATDPHGRHRWMRDTTTGTCPGGTPPDSEQEDDAEDQDDNEPDEEQRDDVPPPVQHIHVYLPDADIDLGSPEDVGPRWWERALDRIRPWHTLVGAALALVPTPTGYSAAATWASTVWYAHEEALFAGYALAIVGVAAAYRAERRCGDGMVRATLVRAWTVCALIGITGAIDLWDPIQIWTGVAW